MRCTLTSVVGPVLAVPVVAVDNDVVAVGRDGERVGCGDGEVVGSGDGAGEGARDGLAVGRLVGSAVGAAEGVPVGAALGAAEGAVVGAAEEAADGDSVGSGVGCTVGAVDGRCVGLRVGGGVLGLLDDGLLPLPVKRCFWALTPLCRESSKAVMAASRSCGSPRAMVGPVSVERVKAE